MVKLSIIVPVYNVEKYISKCIESILSQTFTDFELILVDDGSKDESSKICDYFCQKDNRIKVLHQENFGVSTARNNGLKIAKGRYITFVDSDDWLELDMYESMIERIEQYQCDIAICGHFLKKEKSLVVNEKSTESDMKIMNSKQAIEEMFVGEKFGGHLWDKVLKKELIEDTLFLNDVIMNEDMIFVMDAFEKSKKIIYFSDKKYNYLQREGGASQNRNVQSMYSQVIAWKIFVDKAIKIYASIKEKCVYTFIKNNIALAERMVEQRNINSAYFNKIKSNIVQHKNYYLKNNNVSVKEKIYLYLLSNNYLLFILFYVFIYKPIQKISFFIRK